MSTAHSKGEKKHCLFCACEPKDTSNLRKHCRAHHPCGVDIVSAGKNILGYVFRFVDGHTDRVYATSRGRESPQTIGYCFNCHSIIYPNPELYRTTATCSGIEAAVLGHSCKESKPRATVSRPGATGGGSAASARVGPSVVIDEAFLQKKRNDLKKTFEYEHEADCSVNVSKSVDMVFEAAFKVEGLVKECRELSAQLTAERIGKTTTTTTTANPGLVLESFKMMSKYRSHLEALEEAKKQWALRPIDNDDEDDIVQPYSPADVLEQCIEDSRKLARVPASIEKLKQEHFNKMKELEATTACLRTELSSLQGQHSKLRANYDTLYEQAETAIKQRDELIEQLKQQLLQAKKE